LLGFWWRANESSSVDHQAAKALGFFQS